MYWWHHLGTAVVVPEGMLDTLSYGRLRAAILKAAADEPRAVIVDIDRLRLTDPAVLALFPAVGTELATWPGVPLLLVAAEDVSLRALAEYEMPRLLPVHRSVAAAVAAVEEPAPREVARLELPNGYACLRMARAFVRKCCYGWNIFDDRTVDAIWVTNELVENTVKHTYGPPTLRVELRREFLTVAVFDDDPHLPWLPQPPPTAVVHGLSVVARLCRAWGSAPTATGGKVVWAML